jgi:hypothetical protein
MLTVSNGSEICTGILLNNAMQDGTAYLATSYHCLFGNDTFVDPRIKHPDHKRTMITFEFEDIDCHDPLHLDSSLGHHLMEKTLVGTEYLGGFRLADIALLKIVDPIPKHWNVYFAGWNVRDVLDDGPFYLIHHPVSDKKKVSIREGPLRRGAWLEYPHSYHYYIESWTVGATEPGSSGAPFFDRAGLLIGFLHGGNASCSSPLHDYCSAFKYCYHFLLQRFLDPSKRYRDSRLPGISYAEIIRRKELASKKKSTIEREEL